MAREPPALLLRRVCPELREPSHDMASVSIVKHGDSAGGTPRSTERCLEDVERFFREYGEVEVLEVDDELAFHLAVRHPDVNVADIIEVHANPDTEYFDNEYSRERPEHAPVIMLGYTASGRFLSVPIEPTGQSGVWRARTAFAGDQDHEQRYWAYREGRL